MKRALPRGSFKANQSELTIQLQVNGAIIAFKSGENPDSLYGEDVFAAVFDEATRAREEAWWALRSTLTATRGPVRIIGNVRGRKNWVYRLARSSDQVAYSRITAWDAVEAGIVDRQEILDAQRELPEHIFKELYEALPSDDGGNPFSLRHIQAAALSEAPPVTGPVVVYGVDLAKSTDWTVVVGLDVFGYVVEFHRWQSSWENTKEQLIQILGSTPTLADATGVGDPVVESLQTVEGTHVEAFVFTSSSKQMLMEGLRQRIQLSELSWTEDVITDELEQFEYQYTRTGVRYSAPSGVHDDTVCALALAAKMWREYKSAYWPYDDAVVESSDERNSRMWNIRKRHSVRRVGAPEFAGILGEVH